MAVWREAKWWASQAEDAERLGDDIRLPYPIRAKERVNARAYAQEAARLALCETKPIDADESTPNLTVSVIHLEGRCRGLLLSDRTMSQMQKDKLESDLRAFLHFPVKIVDGGFRMTILARDDEEA